MADSVIGNSAMLLSLTVPTNLQLQDILKEIKLYEELGIPKQQVQYGQCEKSEFSVVDGRLLYKGRWMIPR